ncbi:hypothetical protein SAMN05444162_1847 [Paenibacillaceae bacterium GAS479]|nr:hypothetical protein SAMN05444162_1847 [Paenibacillaceae bacterium GAS479]
MYLNLDPGPGLARAEVVGVFGEAGVKDIWYEKTAYEKAGVVTC